MGDRQQINNSQDTTSLKPPFNRPHLDEMGGGNHGRQQMPSFDRHPDGSGSGSVNGSRINSSSREPESGKSGAMIQQSRLTDTNVNNLKGEGVNSKSKMLENGHSQEKEKEKKIDT